MTGHRLLPLERLAIPVDGLCFLPDSMLLACPESLGDVPSVFPQGGPQTLPRTRTPASPSALLSLCSSLP